MTLRAAIGLRGRDGVVLAVERLVLSKLYEPRAQSSSRIFNIDKHIGMVRLFVQLFVILLYTIFITFKAIGGLLADARAMADYAREECSNFRSNFGIPIPLHVCILISFLHLLPTIFTINLNLFLMKHLSDRLSAYMHAHTLLGSIRPFGCSLILSSYEALPQNKQSVPQLFLIDPSGLSNVLHSGLVACLAIYTTITRLDLA